MRRASRQAGAGLRPISPWSIMPARMQGCSRRYSRQVAPSQGGTQAVLLTACFSSCSLQPPQSTINGQGREAGGTAPTREGVTAYHKLPPSLRPASTVPADRSPLPQTQPADALLPALEKLRDYFQPKHGFPLRKIQELLITFWMTLPSTLLKHPSILPTTGFFPFFLPNNFIII